MNPYRRILMRRMSSVISVLAATLLALIIFKTGVFRLMIAGAALGVLRSYLPVLREFRAATRLFTT